VRSLAKGVGAVCAALAREGTTLTAVTNVLRNFNPRSFAGARVGDGATVVLQCGCGAVNGLWRVLMSSARLCCCLSLAARHQGNLVSNRALIYLGSRRLHART
jgi:hypothetical protein